MSSRRTPFAQAVVVFFATATLLALTCCTLIGCTTKSSAQTSTVDLKLDVKTPFRFVAYGDTRFHDPKDFVITVLNGVTAAGLYFVVSSGFTLIFGLMRVVNMAHGSLYLFAGYLAYKAQANWFHGAATQFSLSTTSSVSVVALVVPLIYATVVIGLVGLAIQQVLLRWNQGQDLRQALITIAVSVIFADQLLAHYGGIAVGISQPTSWPLSIHVGAFRYPFFRLAVVLGAAVVIGVLLFLLIKRTRFGMIVRAG